MIMYGALHPPFSKSSMTPAVKTNKIQIFLLAEIFMTITFYKLSEDNPVESTGHKYLNKHNICVISLLKTAKAIKDLEQ